MSSGTGQDCGYHDDARISIVRRGWPRSLHTEPIQAASGNAGLHGYCCVGLEEIVVKKGSDVGLCVRTGLACWPDPNPEPGKQCQKLGTPA